MVRDQHQSEVNDHVKSETEKLETIKRRIAELLGEHEHLRNYDIDLILVYWRTFDNFDVTPPDKPITGPATIIRVRQKLQAEGQHQIRDKDRSLILL